MYMANAKPAGDCAIYYPVGDARGPFGRWFHRKESAWDWGFERPPSNMMSDKHFVSVCVEALKNCRRDNQEGRGITLEEFEELVKQGDIRGLPEGMRRGYYGGGGGGYYRSEKSYERARKRYERVKKLAFGL